ncbi:hypothetical protein SEA_SONALI_59 [Arthrobacter phage Sonali]|uniref:Uncharacterized protein n=1 Tax=Arthrobacter phage Sonali TaxID=2510495 RepID=A0A411CQH1_9CAUD|nr:hypothetical protein HOV09_gp59 [Arthrobacter phage Sonali]QAY16171.1 hypothetical protein SEA_SONALI_59 [Arthrobacter phage Sonali]
MSNFATPAETQITREYGLRKPDGTVIWNEQVHTLNDSGTVYMKPLQEVHEKPYARAAFSRYLVNVAAEVGIDHLQYVTSHRLLTRDRITVTLAATEVDDESQLAAPLSNEVPF